jgi:FkbM family methyltransferase
MMIQQLGQWVRRKTKYPLKRMVKSMLRGYVYVAKHGLANGFKVTGDLGFLRNPSFTYEDHYLTGLNLTGKTVYDVGAHIGILTLFFARAVGETGQVISFEPNPETFAVLSKNIKLNELANIKAINSGLGEKKDTKLLVFGEAEGALGTLEPTLQNGLIRNKRGIKVKTASVEVVSLDEYIRVNSLPDPDFVKIDVEGYEYNVLLGMQETIIRCKPSLFVEVHGEDRAQNIENMSKIVKLLLAYGYEPREIISRQKITESNFELALKGRILVCEQIRPAEFG